MRSRLIHSMVLGVVLTFIFGCEKQLPQKIVYTTEDRDTTIVGPGEPIVKVISSPITNALNDVDMVSSTIGYIASSTRILKTIDGGKSWSIVNFSSTLSGCTGISFTNINAGFAVAGNRIYRTTNGGSSWSRYYTSSSSYKYWDIEVSRSTSHTYAVGSSGNNAQSFNGGLSWFKKSFNNSFESLKDMHFASSSRRFVCGYGGLLLRSTDSGSNWYNVNTFTNSDLNHLDFPEDNVGFIAGDDGVILKMGTNSWNWSKLITPTTKDLNSIKFKDRYNGIAVGDYGTVLVTSNAGVTWTSIETGITSFFYDVDSTVDGYIIVGSSGTIVSIKM